MQLKRIMSSNVRSVEAKTPLGRVAEVMRDHNVGCLPVVDRGRLAGLITDRDIVVRGLAEKKDPATTAVGEIMTSSPDYLNQNAEVCDAVALMRAKRIRRVPVVDDQDRLVGIVTLTDVALRAHEPIQSGVALLSICAQPALAVL